MRDEAPSPNSRTWRPLTAPENALVRALLRRGSPLPLPVDWPDNALVSPMDDGGMGSLQFESVSSTGEQRCFGPQHSTIEFRDVDDVEVSASLNLDQNMQPFELDIWKTDFSPLVAIPADLD